MEAYGSLNYTVRRLELSVNDVNKLLASVSNGTFETIDNVARVRRRPKSAPSSRQIRYVERSRDASTARLVDDGLRGRICSYQSPVIAPLLPMQKKMLIKIKKIMHNQTDSASQYIAALEKESGMKMETASRLKVDKNKMMKESRKDELLRLRLVDQKLQRESLNEALLRIQERGIGIRIESKEEKVKEKEDDYQYTPSHQFDQDLSESENKSKSTKENNVWDKCTGGHNKSRMIERLLSEYDDKESEKGREIVEVRKKNKGNLHDQETHRTERRILCDEYEMRRKSDENEKKIDEEERNHKEYEGEYDDVEKILERLQISVSKNRIRILQEQNILKRYCYKTSNIKKGEREREKRNKNENFDLATN